MPSGQPLTMSQEHGPLRWQVAVRVEDLLAVIAQDRWPARELQALLAYLRAEVLRQAADEERLLFRTDDAPPAFARLAGDHTRLRLVTEVLAQVAGDEGTHSFAQLARTTRDLVADLERYLSAEEAVLARAGGQDEAPGTTVLTTSPPPGGDVTGRRTS